MLPLAVNWFLSLIYFYFSAGFDHIDERVCLLVSVFKCVPSHLLVCVCMCVYAFVLSI